MLARKLNNSTLSRTISNIKSIGRSPSDDVEHSRRDVGFIVDSMNKYHTSLEVQRTACHALSNIGMHLGAARCVVEKGGFDSIQRSLKTFPDDTRLCWLATSAVWNLARSPHNREVIGVAGTKMMMRVLFRHRDEEKVTNTAMGALSNLSLDTDLKNLIAESESLNIILAILVQYVVLKSVRVMTSAAGLLANLAVSDDHAATLIERNGLSIVMDLLEWDVSDEESILQRNVCAALKNMCSGEGFLPAFLKVAGVERVYDFLAVTESDLHRSLCVDVLNMHEADGARRTTSLHLAAHHGLVGSVQHLIAAAPAMDLDATDEEGNTPLDAALHGGHAEVAQFLARCGAVAFQPLSGEESSEALTDAVDHGKEELAAAREEAETAARDALQSFPEHLCDFVVGWNSNIDMLKGVDMFC